MSSAPLAASSPLAALVMACVLAGCGPRLAPRAPVAMDSYEDPRNPGWVRVTSETGGFSVLMPASPRTDTTGVSGRRGRRFRAETLGSVYFVVFTEIEERLRSNPRSSWRIATLDLWQKQELSNGDRVIEVSPAPQGGYLGRRIKYHRSSGGTADKRVLLVGGRYFTLGVVSSDEVPFPDEDAARFFASFALLPE